MKDLTELEEYIDKTEDVQLGMMLEIVNEYGNEIPEILRKIKEKHVENDEKDKAEMIFSTVHRCKGMEYDTVQLVNDFITEAKLDKILADYKDSEIDKAKLIEEVNLLYVAVTRTKNSLYIPETLIPSEFMDSPHIHVTKVLTEEEKAELALVSSKENTKGKEEKAYSLEKIREEHNEAYKPWTTELDDELTVMYCEGVNVRDMALHFNRTKGAIRSRIKKLELEEIYG